MTARLKNRNKAVSPPVFAEDKEQSRNERNRRDLKKRYLSFAHFPHLPASRKRKTSGRQSYQAVNFSVIEYRTYLRYPLVVLDRVKAGKSDYLVQEYVAERRFLVLRGYLELLP